MENTSDGLAQRRRDRADEADAELRRLFDACGPDVSGLAVVAVGGYGRSELSPHSDLDVVLVHDAAVSEDRVRQVAEQLWYPLWDRGVALDHSVRDTAGMREAARWDVRAAMGMLDARTVAGDAGMVLALRSEVLADWRRDARQRVERVRADRQTRVERFGWVAHAAIPDLKSSGGGLRDGVLMRALVATWLVDVPHAESESLRSDLLDVRDALHEVTGKRSDRLDPDFVPEAAELLGLAPDELDLHTRDLGRRVAHLYDLTWRRLDTVLTPRRSVAGPRGPRIEPVAAGVGRLVDEIVVTAGADPARDPEVALRAAAAAARAGLSLGTGTAARLATTLGDLPEPWPPSARRLLVELLTAGPGLVAVWDELDFAGVIDRWLPEWKPIRLRGSTSPVHRYTVDRHSIETCVEACREMRGVGRPDLLAVAALLHDIGKGGPGDHSEAGEAMAVGIARRWGFDADDAAVIGRLVRWHLLLPTVATRRDIEDPSTAANVAEIVEDADFLDLLAALTAADARATTPNAWSAWRRGLVHGLVAKTHEQLAGRTPSSADYEGWPADVDLPDLDRWRDEGSTLTVVPHQGGSLITVVTADSPGLMARLAGGFATAGLDLRSARSVTIDDAAISMWEVSRADADAARLRDRIRPALAGELDLAARLDRPAAGDDEPRVALLDRSHQTATMLEVRALDRRGLVWLVCRAIAGLGHSIRSAHLSTYGAEVRDVFYVVDAGGEELTPPDAERLRDEVLQALR